MKFNSDDAIGRLLPWDLTITINGKDHAVRPLTIGDVGALLPVVQNKNKDPMKDIEAVMSLFADPKPDAKTMTVPQFMLIASVIMKYIEAYSAKNQQAIAAAASAAMATASDSPSGN